MWVTGGLALSWQLTLTCSKRGEALFSFKSVRRSHHCFPSQNSHRTQKYLFYSPSVLQTACRAQISLNTHFATNLLALAGCWADSGEFENVHISPCLLVLRSIWSLATPWYVPRLSWWYIKQFTCAALLVLIYWYSDCNYEWLPSFAKFNTYFQSFNIQDDSFSLYKHYSTF